MNIVPPPSYLPGRSIAQFPLMMDRPDRLRSAAEDGDRNTRTSIRGNHLHILMPNQIPRRALLVFSDAWGQCCVAVENNSYISSCTEEKTQTKQMTLENFVITLGMFMLQEKKEM